MLAVPLLFILILKIRLAAEQLKLVSKPYFRAPLPTLFVVFIRWTSVVVMIGRGLSFFYAARLLR